MSEIELVVRHCNDDPRDDRYDWKLEVNGTVRAQAWGDFETPLLAMADGRDFLTKLFEGRTVVFNHETESLVLPHEASDAT